MHLLDVVDQVRDDVALGLMSDPGLSKTSQVKQWAAKNNRKYCELIISQRMPSEISGIPMPISESRTMEVFDYNTLLELEDGDVLAFDEFTNGNIQTLNACLTLIQERTMLSGKKLPSLVIVAMGNPQGRCDLLPQTKQRFWWVNVNWDPDSWTDYMKRTWDIIPSRELVNKISNQYRTGFSDSHTFNYITPRTVENLVRIAKLIEREDPFWIASDADTFLIDAIYNSLDMKDTFAPMKQRILSLIDAQDYMWAPVVRYGVEECHTLKDLREFLKKIEDSNVAPELFGFLKEAGQDADEGNA